MVGFISRIIFFVPKRFTHKYIYKMDKAYYRNVEETQQFHFTFKFEDSNLKVDRPFNFVRQSTEPLSAFINRLCVNVEKVISKKNKKCPEKVPQDLNIHFEANNETVSNELPCRDVFTSENNVVMCILGKIYNVVVNSPWIDAILLPSSILATYPVYPSKLETFNTDLKQSSFIWYYSKDKKVWNECMKSQIFTPGNQLIDSYLKLVCTPKRDNLEGPSVEVESENKVQAGPGECPFEIRHKFTKERTPKNKFRVVTYNILADLYCDSDYSREVLHPYCPPYALHIDYRKQLVLKELMGYNADIIGLQEVDRKIFKHDLQPFLTVMDYEGEFAIKGGEVAEGLATFYHLDKFTKLKSSRIVFCDHINSDPLYSHIWLKIAENPKLEARILNLKTTLQILLLQSKHNENELILVGNTHFYFHPDSDHIRILQGGLSMAYIENCLKIYKKEYPGKRISVVFVGDFNSVPDCGIYKLFTTGYIPPNYKDFSSVEDEAVRDLEIKQHINLASACGTPPFTNFTIGFADCLDYIYYQTDNLKVSQVVPMPSTEELTENSALPSIVFPSDHLALITDLEWVEC